MTSDRAARDVWVVARDRQDIYAQLKQRFRDNPNVHVVLDRRVGDRRRGSDQRLPERRRTDRRGPAVEVLAKLWLQGYAVVHVEDQEARKAAASASDYRGYRVEPRSEQLPSGAWAPKAVVTMERGGTVKITPLSPDKTVEFPTREEADRYALDMATRWIGN